MKLMDTFCQYHHELRVISSVGRTLNRVEGTTNVEGLTNIAHLTTLGNSVAEYTKQLLLFQNDPFEPAVIDDLKRLYSDMEQCLRTFEGTPDGIDAKFDARCIVDLQALSELIDIDFKCNVALKKRSQAVDFPRALIVFDLALSGVLHGVYRLFRPDEDFTLYSMTEKLPTKLPISFEILPTQKYFNDEERSKMRAAEQAQEEAIQRAKEEAKQEEECKKYIDNLSKYTFPRKDAIDIIKMSCFHKFLLRAMKVWDTADVPDGKDRYEFLWSVLSTKTSIDLVGRGTFTYGDVACLGRILDEMCDTSVRMMSFNLTDIINNPDDDRVVPEDDIIDVVFEK